MQGTEKITEILKIFAARAGSEIERLLAQQQLELHRDHLEDLVQDRTAELKALNKELESFSYSVSHDLRAPLRSISGFSQAILEDYNNVLDAEGKDHLARVIHNAQHMAELIDDLLDLSRLGRKKITLGPVDFNHLTINIATGFKNNANGRDVEFKCADLGTVTADITLLKVVMDNLLSIAWKYTSMKDKAFIEVGKQQVKNENVFYVEDNGAGFDMAYVDKIFGAFQRLHRQDEFEGSGIGLATVQRILHRHGGRIWAEAEPDKGATFYFTLSGTVTTH